MWFFMLSWDVYAMVNTREIAEEYRLRHWAQVMRDRALSGLSIKGFCKQIGICGNTYYYWQRKLREAACEQLAAPGFVAVAIAEAPAPPVLPTSADTVLSPSQLCIEVAGVRITTDSAYPTSSLAALLRELVRPC